MSAIGKAFEQIGKGIQDAFQGIGNIVKGVFTLDLKGVTDGAKQILGSAVEMGRGMLNLTPPALAANTLMDGAVDKMMCKMCKLPLAVADTVLDTVGDGLSAVKDGVVNVGSSLLGCAPQQPCMDRGTGSTGSPLGNMGDSEGDDPEPQDGDE